MTDSGGVARLESELGLRFENIAKARERTLAALEQRREAFREIPVDSDAAVCLMGSWGRLEITEGSDDDFMVLLAGAERDDAKPSIDDVAQGLNGQAPGDEETFGKHVWVKDLTEKIGRDEDTNTNLTRRMLTILESVAVAGTEVHEQARRTLIDEYLTTHARDFHPPRFLLNDLVRYWRTIAVDFEGKMRDRDGRGWGLRNAKLRLSRKALFAGGLFPVLECNTLELAQMADFLEQRMTAPPLDRIADMFLARERIDSGARALRAYDEFLGILSDRPLRDELSELKREDAGRSELFDRIKRLGDEFELGLLSLLFDDGELQRLVREYLIF
jgi:hypothetical protein